MKKISTPAYGFLTRSKRLGVGLVAQRGRKEVKKMEYGITATFTKEELITIQFALSQYIEKADKMEIDAMVVGSDENENYWFNESVTAKKAYLKVLYNQKNMPW